MNTLPAELRSLFRSFVVGVAALCALAIALTAQACPSHGPHGPQLPPAAAALQVPPGHVVTRRCFAVGVQIYQWNATAQSWVFQGPQALLFPSGAAGHAVGVHFAGPTWVLGGATIVGAPIASYAADPTAIPWLLLAATGTGQGPLADTVYVQRLATVGGRAPARTGTPGEIAQVPYLAQYWFYRAR